MIAVDLRGSGVAIRKSLTSVVDPSRAIARVVLLDAASFDRDLLARVAPARAPTIRSIRHPLIRIAPPPAGSGEQSTYVDSADREHVEHH